MTSTLALIFIEYFSEEATKMIHRVDNNDEDFEDVDAFMNKLEKKIHYYLENSEDKNVFHWDLWMIIFVSFIPQIFF